MNKSISARIDALTDAVQRRQMEQDMATNTEYILRMVLELIDKCKTQEELREAVKAVLDEAK